MQVVKEPFFARRGGNMSTLPDNPYLRPKTVAEYLNVSTRTIERWVAKGYLLSVRVGGTIRISRESIIKKEVEGVFRGVKM